jgi:hypothetical protein
MTALFVVALATGATACGGDDDDATSAPSTTDAADDGDGAATTTPDDDDDDDDDGSNESFTAVLERRNDAAFKVTYDTGGDEVFSVAQDGERRAVMSGNGLVISDAGRTISCEDLDTTPTCSELPESFGGIAALGLNFLDTISEAVISAADAVDVLDRTSDEIAGRAATCIEYDADSLLADIAEQTGEDAGGELGGDARICVDTETGVLLELSAGEGDDAERLVATEFGEPSDEDFEPPAPVEPAPDLDDLLEDDS